MKPSTTTEAREDGEELGRGTSHGPSQLHAEARDPDRVFAPQDLAAGFDILDEALGPSADLDKCRPLRAEEPPGAESGSRDLRRSHAVCDAHELRGILGILEQCEYRRELLGLGALALGAAACGGSTGGGGAAPPSSESLAGKKLEGTLKF